MRGAGESRGRTAAAQSLRSLGEALNGLNADDGRDRRGLESMPRLAEVILHGFDIESAGNLFGRSDGEVLASDFGQTAPLELVLKRAPRCRRDPPAERQRRRHDGRERATSYTRTSTSG